jgi:hypothetical protein
MADTHSHAHHEGHEGEFNELVHHEESDVNVRALLWFLVAFVVTMAIIYGVSKVLFDVMKKMEERSQTVPVTRVATDGDRKPPEPALQDNPARDMASWRNAERNLLGSTQRIDPTTGQIRIPIDRAIAMTARRGIQPVGGGETRVDQGELTPADRNALPADGPATNQRIVSPAPAKPTPPSSPAEAPQQ